MNSTTFIPSAWNGAVGVFMNMLKLAVLIGLTLLLLIPLVLIRGILYERLERRDVAVADITALWGKEQTFVGPVLAVPYRVSGAKESATSYAYFLPDQLSISGSLDTETRYRGIYDAVVYTAALKVSGQFKPPDFAALQIDPQNVEWERAAIVMSISDLRGIRRETQLTWGERQIPFATGSGLTAGSQGLHAALSPQQPPAGPIPFATELSLRGSGRIQLAPIGTQTTVDLESKWPDPSFQGAYPPSESNVTPSGFTSRWEVSGYGRGNLQPGQSPPGAVNRQAFEKGFFGVQLLPQVDAYRNVERAIKYGILFVVMIFSAFFLFETVSGVRIHPIQYSLVGAALCLFYLSLLSLSEFIRFPWAYAIAAASAVGLVSLYCRSILGTGGKTLTITGLLSAIYIFLYVTLQLQDYALLFGTAGLFVMLAIVMFATRRIQWYGNEPARNT